MSDKVELALVLKAVTSGLSNCVQWKNQEVKSCVLRDTGLTPSGFREELARCVRERTHNVTQKVEDREYHRDYYDYVYHFVIPLDGFVHGCYAELVVHINDVECPVVVIVRAHPATR